MSKLTMMAVMLVVVLAAAAPALAQNGGGADCVPGAPNCDDTENVGGTMGEGSGSSGGGSGGGSGKSDRERLPDTGGVPAAGWCAIVLVAAVGLSALRLFRR